MLTSCLTEAIPLTQSSPIASRQTIIESVMLHINTSSRSLLVYHAHSPTPLPLPSGVWGYVRVRLGLDGACGVWTSRWLLPAGRKAGGRPFKYLPRAAVRGRGRDNGGLNAWHITKGWMVKSEWLRAYGNSQSHHSLDGRVITIPGVRASTPRDRSCHRDHRITGSVIPSPPSFPPAPKLITDGMCGSKGPRRFLQVIFSRPTCAAADSEHVPCMYVYACMPRLGCSTRRAGRNLEVRGSGDRAVA